MFTVGSSHFPGGSNGKESAHNAGDPGSVSESGRFPGEGNGHPLQYSCLENSIDWGAWHATINGVTKSQTHMSTNTCTHTHTMDCLKELWLVKQQGLDYSFFSCPLSVPTSCSTSADYYLRLLYWRSRDQATRASFTSCPSPWITLDLSRERGLLSIQGRLLTHTQSHPLPSSLGLCSPSVKSHQSLLLLDFSSTNKLVLFSPSLS